MEAKSGGLGLVKKITASMLMLLLVSACSSMQFNVPPVTTQTGGERLPGKMVWQDLLSDTPAETQGFYAELFGWTFEPLGAGINYTLIRHNGRLIGGMVDQNQLPTSADISQWVAVMSVRDIHRAVDIVQGQEGTVFTPATSLGDRGDIAVVADSTGAILALLQTRDGDPPDSDRADPATGDFLWRELWTDDVDKAGAFYAALAPFEVEAVSLDDQGETAVDYRLLRTEDRPRAGVRSTPAPDMPSMWVSYLRVADLAQMDEILDRVPGLGGEVLVPAIARPGGGHVAVIAGPSGAGIALQTWPLVSSLQARKELLP